VSLKHSKRVPECSDDKCRLFSHQIVVGKKVSGKINIHLRQNLNCLNMPFVSARVYVNPVKLMVKAFLSGQWSIWICWNAPIRLMEDTLHSQGSSISLRDTKSNEWFQRRSRVNEKVYALTNARTHWRTTDDGRRTKDCHKKLTLTTLWSGDLKTGKVCFIWVVEYLLTCLT